MYHYSKKAKEKRDKVIRQLVAAGKTMTQEEFEERLFENEVKKLQAKFNCKGDK